MGKQLLRTDCGCRTTIGATEAHKGLASLRRRDRLDYWRWMQATGAPTLLLLASPPTSGQMHEGGH